MTAHVSGMSIRAVRPRAVKWTAVASPTAATHAAVGRPRRRRNAHTIPTVSSPARAAGSRAANASTVPPFTPPAAATSQ